MSLIKIKTYRTTAKAVNKKVSKEFIAEFERLVLQKLEKACSEHNGGRKILDAGLARYVFGVGLGG